MLVRETSSRIFKPGHLFPARKSEFESYTSISKYLECPVLYHDYYAHPSKREPISKELIFGRAWHGMCEDALVEKMWNGNEMTEAELHDRWHIRWQLELYYARDEMKWVGDQSQEDYFKTGRVLATTWQRDYLPHLDPTKVEVGFWITLTGCKRALTGKIDLLTKDGQLIDHKTSSKTWAELKKLGRVDADELDLQMAIYHGGYQSITKGWPTQTWLHRAILDPSKPRIEPIDLLYTQEQVQREFDTHIKPTMRAIEADWKRGTFECVCEKHTPSQATPPVEEGVSPVVSVLEPNTETPPTPDA